MLCSPLTYSGSAHEHAPAYPPEYQFVDPDDADRPGTLHPKADMMIIHSSYKGGLWSCYSHIHANIVCNGWK